MTYLISRTVRMAGLAAILAAAGSLCTLPAEAGGAGATAWPAVVNAKYKLLFAGFDVGAYQFHSQVAGNDYTATGSADVSALFGAFTWKGTIESKGAVAPAAATPAGYQLNFKSKSKAGSVILKFDKGAVSSVAVVPSKPLSTEAVPIKPDHMKSVFDPMTAILAITHAGPGAPCDKTIPIFDGKARFDLVMSPKGTQKVAEKKPSGQPAELVVCRVRYVPVAGHKPKDFVNPWINYDAIEITLRPVPSAGLYVPYKVTIPTSIGAAVMSAEHVEISAPDKPVIALTQ
jgi:hypothetical protein